MTAGNSGGLAAQNEMVYFERERGVTEVQVTRGVAHVTVVFPTATLSGDRLNLLKALAGATIPVFMVKLLPDGISFALRESVVDAGAALLTERGVKHSILRDLSLVAVVAGAMRDLSGVMALIYQALVVAGVSVRQTGDAYNAVLCLVAGEQADRAATALRDCFFQSRSSEPTADDLPAGGATIARKGF